MKIISHRANLDGSSLDENKPDRIEKVIAAGYDVEVDVRVIDGLLYLGHDSADHLIQLSFLQKHSERLWIHCKNLEALSVLSSHVELNVFWHQEDDFVLTRSGHIWTYPGKLLCEKSIAVMPSKNDMKDILSANVSGICTDDVVFLESLIKTKTL